MILLNIALWLLVLAPVLFFVYMLWAERQVAKGMDRLYEKWRKEDREREKLKLEIEQENGRGSV